MERFWEVEHDSHRILYMENAECENLYTATTHRIEGGRYVVRMPFKDITVLGRSRQRALKRFYAIEGKLRHDEDLRIAYYKFMREYIDLGHMTPVEEDIYADGNDVFYLPHHPVLKPTSTSTKVRVVFDGSASTSNGLSLNDILYTGPQVQQDLMSILLRFRLHRYVITGDIEKFFRQVLIEPGQRNLLRIFWRFNEGDKVLTYHLNTVTYGLVCSMFLSTRTLLQLVDDEGLEYPLGATAIKRDCYVDDLLTGAGSKKDLCRIVTQCT